MARIIAKNQTHVDFDFSQIDQFLTGLPRDQIPFATSLAANWTAKEVRFAQIDEMEDVFDRPTPFTKRSVLVRYGNKRRPNATVFLRDEAFKGNAPETYLYPQMEGGGRKHKPFELLLIRRGLMPRSKYAVPSKFVRLNRYGNVTGGLITRVLSALSAQVDEAQNTKATSKKKYFVGRPGSRSRSNPSGIYERTSKGVRPVFIFVDQPRYDDTYDFDYVALDVVKKRLGHNFVKAMKIALKTRKRK